MSIQAQCGSKHIGRRRWAALGALGLVLALAMPLYGQPGPPARNAPAPPASGVKFEVLEVTTGSGSKTQEQERPALKIEVLNPPPAPGSKAGGAVPAVPPGPGAPVAGGEAKDQPPAPAKSSAAPAKSPAVPAKSPAAPAKGQAAPAKGQAAPAKGQPSPKAPERSKEEKDKALLGALETWHYQALATYDYNILALADPFLPIKEVRGKPEQEFALDPSEEAKLPPILRLETSQLKLVAITVLSDRADGALASFEDGAGNSYILRAGDRIGRRQGRITSITAAQVVVEEPSPRGAGNAPRVFEIKLNATNMDGVSRAPAAPQ